MEFFKRFPVIALALLFSFSGTAISPAAATDAGSPFRDERCPFSARFANGLTPKLGSAPNATSAETSATGYRISYACIANPNAVPAAPLEGQALHDRLSGLAQSLGMRGAKVTVPASPARSCGLIEGQTDAGGKTIKTRTEFCYGPRALVALPILDGLREQLNRKVDEVTTGGKPYTDLLLSKTSD